MEWRGDGKVAPDERAVAASGRRFCSSGMTGVAGFIGVPASNCFATSAWRSRQSLGIVRTLPLQPSLPRRFPGLSVPIIISRGHSGWLAMHVPKLLGG
jgi:hypothetical protein